MFVNSPQSTFTQSTIGHYNYVPVINLSNICLLHNLHVLYVPDSDIFSFYVVNLKLSQTWKVIQMLQKKIIMVIELSRVQFGLKSYAWFKNWTGMQFKFDLKSNYDFRPKLHDLKFSCHLIRSILKLHNLIAKFAKQWHFCLPFPAMWLVNLKEP